MSGAFTVHIRFTKSGEQQKHTRYGKDGCWAMQARAIKEPGGATYGKVSARERGEALGMCNELHWSTKYLEEVGYAQYRP